MAVSKKDMTVGTVHRTKQFGLVKVIEFHGCDKVTVQFINTGYITSTQATHVRRGAVRDKMVRTVHGVGFLGGDKYKVKIQGTRKTTREYNAWNSMISRCYNPKYQERFPTYKGCTVCDEWHNFQIFAEWYINNHPDSEEMHHLDKDILSGNIKIYSPKTCLIIPARDNLVYASAKTYKFRNPSGEIQEIYNLSEFCKLNKLNNSAMRRVLNGLASHHKGWKRA